MTAPKRIKFPDDGLTIPAFLLLTPKQRADGWKRRPPKPFVLIEQPKVDPQAALLAAALTADKDDKRRRQQATRRAKINARDALPADFNPIDYRWGQRKGRFERDPFAHLYRQQRGLQSGFIESVIQPTRKVTMTKGRKHRNEGSVDDLGRQVSVYIGTDWAKLNRFAEANSVWEERYGALGDGLRRMTIVNRLRGKIKKDPKYTVVWP